jgi:hypothetical protein
MYEARDKEGKREAVGVGDGAGVGDGWEFYGL